MCNAMLFGEMRGCNFSIRGLLRYVCVAYFNTRTRANSTLNSLRGWTWGVP